ncbi:hypothetical protein D3C79_798950 [compost metagenome]
MHLGNGAHHCERQRALHHHEVLKFLLRLLAELSRDRHGVHAGQHAIQLPRHVWVDLKVRGSLHVGADPHRAAVDGHPLARVAIGCGQHLVSVLPVRFILTAHELGNHLAQVVDVLLAVRHIDDHPLAETLRLVGDVLPRQVLEDAVHALAEELVPAGQQVHQG